MRDIDDIRDKQTAEKKRAEMARKAIENDAREVLQSASFRRLLRLFWEETGEGTTPFNPNAMTMARDTGRLEAAVWWRNLIRNNCPEMEARVRRERLATTTRDEGEQ